MRTESRETCYRTRVLSEFRAVLARFGAFSIGFSPFWVGFERHFETRSAPRAHCRGCAGGQRSSARRGAVRTAVSPERDQRSRLYVNRGTGTAAPTCRAGRCAARCIVARSSTHPAQKRTTATSRDSTPGRDAASCRQSFFVVRSLIHLIVLSMSRCVNVSNSPAATTHTRRTQYGNPTCAPCTQVTQSRDRRSRSPGNDRWSASERMMHVAEVGAW